MGKFRFIVGGAFVLLSLSGITQNVGIGTTAPGARLDLNGDLILRSFTLVIGNAVNYDLDVNANKFVHYRITGPTANFAIAGIAAGEQDRLITLHNVTGHSMELYNDDPLCLIVPNRILTGTGTTIAIFPYGTVTLQYDITMNRWRVIAQQNSNLDNFGGSWGVSGTHIYNPNAGNVGIGVSNPVYAGLETSKLVNNTAAIFGSGEYGISLEANNPSVGFNFYNYSQPSAIKGNGHSAIMGLNVPDGEFYIGSFGNTAVANNSPIPGAWSSFRYIFRSYKNGVSFFGLDTVSLGRKFMWYGNKGAMEAGELTGQSFFVGIGSAGFGYSPRAYGNYSFAAGYNAYTVGSKSIALGDGVYTQGTSSIAIGTNSFATGNNSMALGYKAHTNGRSNSVCIGASGNTTSFPAVASLNDNEFMVFADHYRLWTGTGGTSVYMTPGGNAWLSTCDKFSKENFEPVNGEKVLQKLSAIPLSSWNYKKQDPRKFRHYGIAAQDFYNAFGTDSYGVIGNDTAINPVDLIGIAYSGIQALEVRTQKMNILESENRQLRAALDELTKQLAAMQQKVEVIITSANNKAK